MASNKVFNFGPIALTATLTTNLLNPPTATGGTNGGSSAQYIVLKRLRITNITLGAVTCTLYKGATGANVAGTALVFAQSIPANSSVDIPCPGLRFDAADFLVGGASAGASLNLEGEGEIGVSG